MEKQNLIHAIATKFQNVQSVLHERGLRIWAVTEAQQIGWGSEMVVAQATGMSRTTIRRGMLEINTNQVETLDKLRSRLPGGARKKITEHYPDIKHDLDALIDPLALHGDNLSFLFPGVHEYLHPRLSSRLQHRRWI